MWEFEIQTDLQILATRPSIMIIEKKIRICHQSELAIPTVNLVKTDGCEKLTEYLDLARERKNLWNVNVVGAR